MPIHRRRELVCDGRVEGWLKLPGEPSPNREDKRELVAIRQEQYVQTAKDFER